MEQINQVLQRVLKVAREQESFDNLPRIKPSQMAMAVEKRAKNIGIDFIVDDDNYPAMLLIMQYFAREKEFEKEGRSLRKGLMLFGNTGCGKTLTMQLCQNNIIHPFTVINCREVGDEYESKGVEGLKGFHTVFMNKLIGICFDDFGNEPIKNHFGSTIDVMEDVMLARYRFGEHYTTHITTNKTTKEIAERYGTRIASRFREMFNIIEFPTVAKDRRV